jgi:hypothetical protein
MAQRPSAPAHARQGTPQSPSSRHAVAAEEVGRRNCDIFQIDNPESTIVMPATIVPNVKELLHGVVDGKIVMRQLAAQRTSPTWLTRLPIVATRRNGDAVTLDDFTVAIERIVAGLEKKSRVLGPEERRRVAYHEMGHALVAARMATRRRSAAQRRRPNGCRTRSR